MTRRSDTRQAIDILRRNGSHQPGPTCRGRCHLISGCFWWRIRMGVRGGLTRAGITWTAMIILWQHTSRTRHLTMPAGGKYGQTSSYIYDRKFTAEKICNPPHPTTPEVHATRSTINGNLGSEKPTTEGFPIRWVCHDISRPAGRENLNDSISRNSTTSVFIIERSFQYFRTKKGLLISSWENLKPLRCEVRTWRS